jgi:hypothetical protein
MIFQEFSVACNKNEHFWGLAEKPRPDGHGLFAEFLLSAVMADMIMNPSPYGHVIDCGLISGISDTFTSRGHAVLEVSDQRSMNNSSPLMSKLQYTIHWQFTQLSIRPSVRNNDYVDATTVYWYSINPYCRYCHNQDHVLADCEKRLSLIICFNCNASGHISRLCLRRNTPVAGISNKHSLKTPFKSIEGVIDVTTIPPIADTATSITTPTADTMITAPSLSGDKVVETSCPIMPVLTSISRTCLQSKLNNESNNSTSPVEKSLDKLLNEDIHKNDSGYSNYRSPIVCKHCNLSGHQRTNHKDCLKNPKNITKILLVNTEQDLVNTGLDTDMDMYMMDTGSTNNSQSLNSL